MRTWSTSLTVPFLLAALAAPFIRCAEPCEKLAEVLCEKLQDERACQKTKQDLAVFEPETCKAALRIYEDMLDRR